MTEELETARLTLRPIATSDVDLLVALDSDPEVMRFISGGKPTSRAEAERILQRSLGHRWLGFERRTGAFVGWFGIRPSTAKSRELGYRLRREAWGKGLATEGARAVIAVAFTQPGVDRVRAETMAVNSASRAVMERCGLRFVRAFHLEWDEPIAGTEHGEVEYEITKSEWRATNPACLRSPS
jgi:RimJ/RimL family protein N-acetyltransferase